MRVKIKRLILICRFIRNKAEARFCFDKIPANEIPLKLSSDSCILMASTKKCSKCLTKRAESMCICAYRPILCSACRADHEVEPDFHFPLSLEFLEQVTEANHQQYKEMLLSMTNCHKKLRADLQLIDQCRGKIETVYGSACEKLTQGKIDLLKVLDTLKKSLTSKVEAAIKETAAHPFRAPSSPLASLIQTHTYEKNSESLSVFHYQVSIDEKYLQDCLKISYESPLPELSYLHRSTPGATLQSELQMLKDRIMEVANREYELQICCGNLKHEVTKLQGEIAEGTTREQEYYRNYQELRTYCGHLELEISTLRSSQYTHPLSAKGMRSPKVSQLDPLPKPALYAYPQGPQPYSRNLPENPGPAMHRPGTAQVSTSPSTGSLGLPPLPRGALFLPVEEEAPVPQPTLSTRGKPKKKLFKPD